MNRVQNLQDLLNTVAKAWNIPQSFIEASDHSYFCRCDGCKEWWRQMGPDPEDESYGPFTKEELFDDRS